MTVAKSQTFIPNYDESKVPYYTLPDPLIGENGEVITNAQQWNEERRNEIIGMFEEHMFGTVPSKPENINYMIAETDCNAFNGQATRKQIVISITDNDKTIELNLLIYMPNNGNSKHPVFLGLNFYGNQSISSDQGITLSKNWMRTNDAYGIVNNKATEASRGVRAHRWPAEYILQQGYALATMYCGDIDPDYDDDFQNGIHSLFYKNGQTKTKPDEWGTIAAWSWGLSRVMDYFENDASIDSKKVIVFGHSRLAKAALWAGAIDERFAIVISNDSGCGGAALSRRHFGETISSINSNFPHWFCGNFKKYNENENELPIDQHMLLALIAPRPLYIASAAEDLWADPYGEFLSAKNAGSVYKLFGKKSIENEAMPEIEQPVMNTVGYHIRNGKHDLTKYDWQQFIRFSNKHLKN